MEEPLDAIIRSVEENDETFYLSVGAAIPAEDRNRAYSRRTQNLLFESIDGAEYSRLGRSIGRSRSLFSLEIHGDRLPNAVATRDLLEGIERNASIVTLSLIRCDISQGAVGYQVLNSFANRTARSLKQIQIKHCHGLNDGGARVLASTLSASRGEMNQISISGCGLGDESLVDVAIAMRENNLRRLTLARNSIGRRGCYALSDVLREQDSSLIDLVLTSNNIDDEGVDSIVRSLSSNRILKNLHLFGNEQITEIRESSLSDIICNTASVNSTYLSNHRLSRVSGLRDRVLAPKLRQLLQCNEREDKSLVAMEKIFRCHPHIDMAPFFEWDMKCLPLAVSWFDDARDKLRSAHPDHAAQIEQDLSVRKLSAMFQFVCATPWECVPAATGKGVKRKLNEVSDSV